MLIVFTSEPTRVAERKQLNATLRPCPFCKASAKAPPKLWAKLTGDERNQFQAVCETCECRGPLFVEPLWAHEEWNRMCAAVERFGI